MFRTIAAASAMLLAAPVSAEVVETSANGFVTRDTANVAASPMEAWLALTRPGLWWNDSHTWSGDAANMTLTPQAGGCFCERVPGEDREDGFSLDGSVQHMTVVQAYPLRVLRMRGGLGPLQGEPATGILTITLKEVDGGTRILWEYNVGGAMRYVIAEISKAVDAVMSQQLAGLRDHLGALDASPVDESD
ncbi:SRPBCC family protein [Qipengyuania sp. 6B39]|uniref:SRPBCC family protein n=1 Tax=Qipengyuania proteolytica TaxID=2867239 RepID=UPI001C893027|nr:SRPBCC family protein [Qipengyuania proteolytica]MBX7496493.1 SRPBCC family protein [Qipengyuania proteolytica]